MGTGGSLRELRAGGVSGATGGATGSAGRRRAASSRCAISARFWSALDGAGAGEGAEAAAPRRVQALGPASHEPPECHGQAAPHGLAVPRGLAVPHGLAMPHGQAAPHGPAVPHGLAVPWATRAAAVASAARCGGRRGGAGSGRPLIDSGAKPVNGSLRRSGIGGGAGRRISSAKAGRAGRGGGSGICGSG